MSDFKPIRLNVTTNGSGAGSATATFPVLGKLYAVEMIDGDLADGVDATITVTGNASGVDVTLLTLTDWNADGWYYPRKLVQSDTGANLTAIYDLFLVEGYLKLTIAQGGDTKTGGCILYVCED